MAAPTRLFASHFGPQGSPTRNSEEIISWVASFLQRYNNIVNLAIIFGPIFAKLVSDFNLNISTEHFFCY